MERTFADLTKYIKRAPGIEVSISIILILFLIQYFSKPLILHAVLFILVPSSLTLAMDQIASVLSESKLNLRKNLFLLALTLVMFYIIYSVLQILLPTLGIQNVAISLSFTTFFRFLVFYVYLSDSMAANYALSNTLSLSFIPLYLFSGKYVAAGESIIYTLISSWLGYIFVTGSTKKFREEFNTEPRDLIKFFLYGIHGNKYYESGDRFCKAVYKNKRVTGINSLIFRDENKKPLFSMIFPYIHPGPFGTVGSSDLPERITKYVSGTHGEPMVFHTATTNSDNCAGEDDIMKLGEALTSFSQSAESVEGYSGVYSKEVSGVRIDVFRIGNNAMVAFNPADTSFDDILYEEGQRLARYIEEKTGVHAFIVDGQNSFVRGARELEDLTPYQDVVVELIEKGIPSGKINAGFSSGKPRGMKFVAGMGIQVLVLEKEGEYDCIILTDSNNVTREMEELIRKRAMKHCRSLSLYTTDNHVVNSGTIDMNPLDSREESVIDQVESLIVQAKSAVKEFSAYSCRTSAEVSTGNKNTYQHLMDTVFVSLRRAKYYAVVTVFLTFFIPLALSLTGIVLKIPFI